MRKYLICFFLLCISSLTYSQEILKHPVKDKFYTTSLDLALDSIAAETRVTIIFDRQLIQDYHFVYRFFSETLKSVLTIICNQYRLYYALEGNNTIYVMKRPDDLPKLKKQVSQISNGIGQELPIAASKPAMPPAAVKVTQINFNLTGKIVDLHTGESLPGAGVRIENTTIAATTNVDGFFSLSKVPSDTCVLSVTYAGYQKEYVRLTADNIKAPLNIKLISSYRALDEVVIIGKKEGVMTSDAREVSVLHISPSKLDELPNIGERDILRSFQLMPGISGSNESSSGAYVRGGTPDQNLVLFDGFTVYQVDHLYGFFSAFNTNAVKDVQLYKGGFSARYGGRLSSVTDIQGKEGNNKETNIGGDLSLLSVNLYGESPVGKKSTMLFSVRKSYQGPLYNKLFNKFNNNGSSQESQNSGGFGPGGGRGFPGGRGFGPPTNNNQITSYFYDLNSKYTFAPNDKDRFSLSLYSGSDKLDNGRDINIPSGLTSRIGGLNVTDLTNYGNIGSSIKWSRMWNSSIYSNSLLSFSNYFSNRDRSTDTEITDADGYTQAIKNGTLENNDLRDFSFRTDWEWSTGNNYKVSFGAFASRVSIQYSYSQNDTSKLVDQDNTGLTAGTYGELELNKGNLRITPGLRLTYYGETARPYIEPRLSASYALSDVLMLKGSTGRFYQFSNRVIREDILSGSRDFWVMADGEAIPVGSAWHLNAGISHETAKYIFSAEAYYKRLDGLTEYSLRIQNSRGPGGFGGPGGTATLQESFYNGQGYSRGIELLAQKKTGKYSGWLSYTFGQARNKFEVYSADYYPANQDVTHEFKSVNMYRTGRWNFSATWIFATGRPYTAPLGSYTIDRAGTGTQSYLTISGKNAERLPVYHRLDASVTFDFLRVNTRKIGSLGLSLFNLYDRTNIWYKEYELQNNTFLISNINYLGFTPNLTLSIKWK